MRGLFAIACMVLAGFAFTGCDRNPMGTVDQRGNAPSVSSFSVVPSGARIDTISPANGLYAVKAVVSARVTDPDGPTDISQVNVQALSPGGAVAAEVNLRDDGSGPDAAAGDGLYTGTLQLSLARSDIGIYRIVYSARDHENLAGTSALREFPVIRRSSPPWLYNLSAPDSVTVPPAGDTLAFRLSVAVGDSDGLADIRSVTLRILGSSNPNAALPLNDDKTPPDSAAGDGVYSIGLSVYAPRTIPGRYTLAFQATDKAGDTSATLLHPFLIR